MNESPSMLKPALISGLLFGFVSAVPVLGMINCACCALIIGTGFVAALLYSRDCKPLGLAFRAGDGAKVGLLSGVFYAVTNTFFSTIANFVFGLADWQKILDQLSQSGMDEEVLDTITHFMESGGPFVIVLVGFVVSLVLGLIFATIGGLIGGAVFKVEPTPVAPAAPPQAPPPPPVEPGNPV